MWVSLLCTRVSIVPSSVLVNSTSKKGIIPSFSFSIVNLIPLVMLLIVLNNVLMLCFDDGKYVVNKAIPEFYFGVV